MEKSVYNENCPKMDIVSNLLTGRRFSMVDPVSNLSLKDRVAALLRREISTSRVPDGEELTQENVSQALAVSRIPVREAFLQLENEGLLQRLPNRHVRVIGPTPRRIRQNFRMMAAIEAEIISQISAGWTSGGAEKALESARRAAGEGPRNAFLHWENAFHLALSLALDNPSLHQLHELRRRGLCLDAVSLKEEELLRRDEMILTCLKRGDTPAAEAAVREYYAALCAAATKR